MSFVIKNKPRRRILLLATLTRSIWSAAWLHEIADRSPGGDTIAAAKTRATYTVSFARGRANVFKAAALVKRDVSQMQEEDVSAAELLQAKALWLRQIPLGESSEDATASELLDRATLGLALDEARRAAARCLSLTAVEIRSAFARRIRPGDFVSVVRGPVPH